MRGCRVKAAVCFIGGIMIASIINIILGIVFAAFGYRIYYIGEYGYINDFELQKEKGLVTDEWARVLGKIFLIIGTLLILSGIAGFIFRIVKLIFSMSGIIIILFIVLMIRNRSNR